MIKFIRWSPPRLPMRGCALLLGPLAWEVEIHPDNGRLATAYVGIRLSGASWYLEFVPFLRLIRCGRDALNLPA